MNYEKKYKEALELARVAAFNGHQSLMEGIFPELKESEDEQIRKKIIALFKGQIPSTSGEDNKKFVAWLEKQGEKPQRMISAEAKEAMYDKPAWSEEDEIMIANIRDDLFCYQTSVRKEEDHQLVEDIEKERIWLKSIKRRIGG